MKYLFLHYPKCGTCIKAAKWLRTNGIDVEARDITLQNPTVQELSAWIPASGLTVRRFFNTSGKKYRELNMKEKMKTATCEELLSILASDGKLVKRPLLVTADFVLVGFDETVWRQRLATR